MPPKYRPIKNKVKAEIPLTSNPPSHPHEFDPQHRAFLKRSLDRSDNEIAAVQTLHRSLFSIKNAIEENYGTGALLDIGEGLVSISGEDQSLIVPNVDAGAGADASAETSFYNDEKFRALAKDYILRLKLRRRLLNRIARRIMRLSHAMDGKIQKVVPPPNPKYGEVRLLPTCDEYKDNFQKYKDHLKIVEEAKKRVDARIKEADAAAEAQAATVAAEARTEIEAASKAQEAPKEDATMEAPKEDVTMEAPADSSPKPDQDIKAQNETPTIASEKQTDGDVKMEDDSTAKKGDDETKEKEAVDTSVLKNEGDNVSAATDMEVDTKTEESKTDPKPEIPASAKSDPEAVAEPKAEPEPEPVVSAPLPDPLPPLLLNKEHQEDLEKLIEYDEEYAKKKTTNIPTSMTTIKPGLTPEDLQLVEKSEEDFDYDPEVIARSDIGAVTRGMSAKDKLSEWKRWQSQLLGKIHDQPTFEDLGIKSRVFCLKERRELLSKEIPNKDKDDNEDNDVKEDQKDTNSDSDNDNAMKSEEESDAGKSNSEKEVKAVEEFMNKKALSLEPVPSFHDQDYHRCLMIHSDLLTHSLKDNARKSIAQATLEYNDAFRLSSEYQTTKLKLESEQKKALLDYRVKLELWTTTRRMAYAKWENEKKIFEAQQLARKRLEYQSMGKVFTQEHSRAMQMDNTSIIRRALKDAVDRVVIRTAPKEQARGTEYTSAMAESSNPMKAQIATSLAHCVDVVVNRAETGWISNAVLDKAKSDTYPPFEYPNNPRTDIVLNEKGENLEKLQARIAVQLEKISKHLATCESVRSQKWSKLMKAKQEADGSSGGATTQAPQRKTYTTNRVQPVVVNNNVAMGRAAMTYSQMNTGSKPMAGGGVHQNPRPSSDSKYSAENVKARMSADGSVRPINMPKQTKDGFFMRPAGRQRKGMDWDAVNGKWVPQGSLMSHR